MLLSYTDSPSPSRSTSYHGGLREFGFLLQPPLLSSFEERLGCFLKVLLSLLLIYFLHVLLLSPRLFGRILHALEYFFALPTHWVSLTASLASHLFDDFPTVVWLGLATCWRRTSERTLSLGSLHALVSCFTRFHKVLGWSSCLALSNQQACVRPCCFTGRPRPLGTGFFNGSTVLSIDLLLPPFRFLTCGFLATGSPRLTASLSSSVTGKAPC